MRAASPNTRSAYSFTEHLLSPGGRVRLAFSTAGALSSKGDGRWSIYLRRQTCKPTSSRYLRKDQMINRLVLSTLTLFALVFAGNAVASAGWTPALAAAKVKATYTTVDPVRLATYQEQLDAARAAGLPDTDPKVIRLLGYVEDAKHGARPERATCTGVGKATSGRFAKFHCVAYVTGIGEYTGDFHAKKRLTVVVRPFRIVAGWR